MSRNGPSGRGVYSGSQPPQGRGPRGERSAEPADEGRLADAGLAADEDEPPRPVARDSTSSGGKRREHVSRSSSSLPRSLVCEGSVASAPDHDAMIPKRPGRFKCWGQDRWRRSPIWVVRSLRAGPAAPYRLPVHA